MKCTKQEIISASTVSKNNTEITAPPNHQQPRILSNTAPFLAAKKFIISGPETDRMAARPPSPPRAITTAPVQATAVAQHSSDRYRPSTTCTPTLPTLNSFGGRKGRRERKKKERRLARSIANSVDAASPSTVSTVSVPTPTPFQPSPAQPPASATTTPPTVESTDQPQPILLDTPPTSSSHVSFNHEPVIHEISFNNGIPSAHRKAKDTSSAKRKKLNTGEKKPTETTTEKTESKPNTNYTVKDKTLFLSASMKPLVDKFAKKFATITVMKDKLILKYRRRVDVDTDLRALGLLAKNYVENKLLVNNLSYKETDESVRAFFEGLLSGEHRNCPEEGAKNSKKPHALGKGKDALTKHVPGESVIEKVVLEKNTRGFCTGKATVTTSGPIRLPLPLRLNGRLLRVERIKKEVRNTARLHLCHMDKTVNISRMRAILKPAGFVPKSIRIDMVEGKGLGYGFVDFGNPDEAERFIKAFPGLRKELGSQARVEYSKEKYSQCG